MCSAEYSWLLIFDNAEDGDVLLPYWLQACSNGSSLITSRNHNLMFDSAEDGVEIPAFSAESGSKLLLHVLRRNVVEDVEREEAKSALELARQLDGHPLAISCMAGLIRKRNWTIPEALDKYERDQRVLHRENRQNPLSTIWRLAFQSLTSGAAALLGILAYINPDSVPEKIFTSAEAHSLPPSLREEFDFDDIVETLLTLALIKRDKDTKAYSTHRLIQTQYRYHISRDGRQNVFNQAVKLLLEGFGRVNGQLDDRWTHCQIYIQQILSLKENYKKERSQPERLYPTLNFCSLLANSSRGADALLSSSMWHIVDAI